MIAAKDELQHLVDCLSGAEAEQALALLGPLSRGDGPARVIPAGIAEDIRQVLARLPGPALHAIEAELGEPGLVANILDHLRA